MQRWLAGRLAAVGVDDTPTPTLTPTPTPTPKDDGVDALVDDVLAQHERCEAEESGRASGSGGGGDTLTLEQRLEEFALQAERDEASAKQARPRTSDSIEKKALLAKYAYSEDEEPEEPAGNVEVNLNASKISAEERAKREAAKASHEAKVRRDKEALEIDRERKEKAKRKTQKRERRRM
eukprot:CAMPEP_0177660816 /NCGR_PEP_ID=MMETSP0447-20121125/18279_1 /TAXON_ID=0 /ORGANISM="Stygamoeba regulata, Strain BSH-02190019" /LENGTH=179 /DNA_ID=CAMNT_0019165981 /DNA_START=57 /DNA_END=597 /DNA_ORIENTATION=+